MSSVWPAVWGHRAAVGLQGRPLSTSLSPRCLRRQQDLFRVLKAYTLYRPEEGYCQAQAPIAAVLLMHMPAEVGAGSRVVLGGRCLAHGTRLPQISAGVSVPQVCSACPLGPSG